MKNNLPETLRDIRSLCAASQRKIDDSDRIRHILVGYRRLEEDAHIRMRDYFSDSEFDADVRELTAKGADIIYAVHSRFPA